MFEYSKMPIVNEDGWFDTVRWHVNDVVSAMEQAGIVVTQELLERFFESRGPKTLHDMCVHGGNEALADLVSDFKPDRDDNRCACGSGEKIIGHTPLGKAVCDHCQPREDDLFCSNCSNPYPYGMECYICTE